MPHICTEILQAREKVMQLQTIEELQEIKSRVVDLEHFSWGVDGKNGTRSEIASIKITQEKFSEKLEKIINNQTKLLTGVVVLCFIISTVAGFFHK